MQLKTIKTIAVFVLLTACSRESLQSASFPEDGSKKFDWSDAATKTGVAASIVPAIITIPYLVPGIVITGVAHIVKEGVVEQYQIDAWKEVEHHRIVSEKEVELYRIYTEKEINKEKYKGAKCVIYEKEAKPDGTVILKEFISYDENGCTGAHQKNDDNSFWFEVKFFFSRLFKF